MAEERTGQDDEAKARLKPEGGDHSTTWRRSRIIPILIGRTESEVWVEGGE